METDWCRPVLSVAIRLSCAAPSNESHPYEPITVSLPYGSDPMKRSRLNSNSSNTSESSTEQSLLSQSQTFTGATKSRLPLVSILSNSGIKKSAQGRTRCCMNSSLFFWDADKRTRFANDVTIEFYEKQEETIFLGFVREVGEFPPVRAPHEIWNVQSWSLPLNSPCRPVMVFFIASYTKSLITRLNLGESI